MSLKDHTASIPASTGLHQRSFQKLLNLALILSLLASLVGAPFIAPAWAAPPAGPGDDPQASLDVGTPQPISPYGATITATGYGGSVAAPPAAIPTLIWTVVADAKTYRVQFSRDIAFTSNVTEFVTTKTQLTPHDVGRLGDGEWFWRVRVEAPEVGFYSSPPAYFTRQWATPDNAPVLLRPLENETIEFFEAAGPEKYFSWTPVVGAGSYRFQISSDPGFPSLLYNVVTLATTHQPTFKLDNGTYYWRVIPYDPANREGAHSPTWMFIQAYGAGSGQIDYNDLVPDPIAPENNSLPSFTPTFRWTAVRGAQTYQLQYSTNQDFSANLTNITTKNTSFTPIDTLPNDTNYYWRVRAISGKSISDWSPTRVFQKKWYFQPYLLTPTNNYQYVRFPFFSWTPVPGASYYKIEMSLFPEFISPIVEFTSNPYYTPREYEGSPGPRYWRVTPYDGNGRQGLTSEVFSFDSEYTNLAPHLIHPLYYYPPNQFDWPEYIDPPSPAGYLNPHEDRTVPLPLFIWHRETVPYPQGGTLARAYRVQVGTDENFDNPVVWQADTENTSATPTLANPFTPQAGVDYYWRVCALDSLGGSCMIDPNDQDWWSQTWRTRIDLSKGMAPTSGAGPELITPPHGSETVEATPWLQWKPKAGADSYQVQISRDANFGEIVNDTTVPYPVYSPSTSLAQRLLNRLDYGTFYWRVRARSGGSPLGEWSTARRFQIASQSNWTLSGTLGAADHRLQVAVNTRPAADSNYQLTKLNVTHDNDFWYFNFPAATGAQDMVYVLYLDIDHLEGSGADFDARGYNLSTIPAHQPEYAIYIFQNSGVFSRENVRIYPWLGSGWGAYDRLVDIVIGESVSFSDGYLEIKVPNTNIGYSDVTGSYALALFSVNPATNAVVDAAPTSAQIPGSGLADRFTSVSERVNLVMPPSSLGGDPTTYTSIPPFFWDYPTGSSIYSPWAGAKMEVNLDPKFTGLPVTDFRVVSNAPYYAPPSHPWFNDFIGDNSYYWRVMSRYLVNNVEYFGAWSEPRRLERVGFVPVNLRQSVSFDTPTFSWDRVEGAELYELEVDEDPNFGSPYRYTTRQTDFTPTNAYINGIYFWRVRVRRWGNVYNEWSPTQTFQLALPAPTNLTPNDPNAQAVVGAAPTLCWDPVIANLDGQPVMAAYRYRLQVSKGDPEFSAFYDALDVENNCWTPTKAYEDGKYYWRVAMLDGENHQGAWSAVAEFTKQYPITTLLAPLTLVLENPAFSWTPVQGAAAYRLQISQWPTFSPMYDEILTHATQWTPLKNYDFPRTYYWRVAIIDKDGKLGPFNDAQIIFDPAGQAYKVFLPTMKKKR